MIDNRQTSHSHHLPDWLRRRALLSPDRLALVVPARAEAGAATTSDPTGRNTLTFAELDRAVDAAAAALARADLRPGDRVGLLARNGTAYVVHVHALARLGAVLVPLNTRLTAAELDWQLADVGATFLLHDDHDRATAEALACERPGVRLMSIGAAAAVEPRHDATPTPGRPTFGLEEPHCVIYTSGTTGRPKGAILTYGNHWWSAIGSALHLGARDDDRWLAALPLFHVGGLAILLRGAIYGMAVVVHEAFDPAAVNCAIDRDGVTLVSVVATMLRRMLEERGERPYPPSLRCLLLGGGPAPRDLLETCIRRGIPVAPTYGLSEAASQVATFPPDAARAFVLSRDADPVPAGWPLFPTEVRIAPDATSPDGAGEILVRGPTVTPGYVGRPDATATVLRRGWLHTGDVGRIDERGLLYVLDRRDDLIVSGGENIYPAEVEATLLAHPDVRDAGVVAAPHPDWGQVPVAAVVLRPAATADPETLRAHCRARLAGYKVPARVVALDTLPRNAAGKLLRRELRALIGGAGEDTGG